jgi:hypothetical protein
MRKKYKLIIGIKDKEEYPSLNLLDQEAKLRNQLLDES